MIAYRSEILDPCKAALEGHQRLAGTEKTVMSMLLDNVFYPLWVSHPVLEAALAILMLKRKLLKRYPIFFCYLVAEVMVFVTLFATRTNNFYYYYLYWIGIVISVGFGFRVIHEVFTDVLRPFHALRDFSALLFWWVGILVLLIAAVAALSGLDNGPGLAATALLSMQRSIRVMQCGLVLFLIMFSRYLGISHRHPSFGIALGFGTFAGLELAALGMHQATLIRGSAMNMVAMAAYDVALAVWGVYLFKPVLAMRKAEDMLRSQRWDMSLSELTHPVPAESLLPMFDAMVDRALSRNENNTPATENHQPHSPAETPARLLDLSTPKRAVSFVSQALAPLQRKA